MFPAISGVSADETSKSIGRIVLDASFSPVKRVSYTVESARVEQRTDLDKLVVEIETNGAITAEDAVRASAKILVEQLAVFAQLEGGDIPVFPGEGSQRSNATFDPILLRPVDELELPCARPIALRQRTFTTLVISFSERRMSCSRPRTWVASHSMKSRKFGLAWPHAGNEA